MNPTLDSILGCLFGIAIGDAIGAPVEGSHVVIARKYVKDHLQNKNFKKAPVRTNKGSFAFGQIADDTQLSLELTRSLISCNTFDIYDFAKRLVNNRKSFVGTGRSTEESLQRLSEGASPYESGSWDRQGNGAAVRIMPLGIFYVGKSIHDLRQSCVEQSLITHQHSHCRGGAYAIASCLWMLLSQIKNLKNDLLEEINAVDYSFSDKVRELFFRLELDLTNSRDSIYNFIIGKQTTNPSEGITPWVVTSVLWSLYCVLNNKTNYWQGISDCVWAGGDTDTMAAMAGGIIGANIGFDELKKQVPQEIFDQLNDRGILLFDEICHLGQELFLACKTTH